ncbi:MAG: NAD-dependent epimerase/dehydratase family protein [Sphingobacteriales bacterium JAD_PAG50586_3]|nr:MAG: NAD-dependent epimerase/dehydratase family protein [Sphingobacteriales bacterium JAD_PAG50586_3]
MPNVLITGGSGLLGKRLATLLTNKGYTLSLLSREIKKPNSAYSAVYLWDVEKGTMDDEALTNCDYIIHLAGAGIADKGWTKERKREIIESRVKSSELLYNRLKYVPNKVKAVVSASATGFYGAVTQDEPFSETDAPGNDFLGQCCIAWENAVNQIKNLNIRTANIRTGVVLSTEGGALKKIADLS